MDSILPDPVTSYWSLRAKPGLLESKKSTSNDSKDSLKLYYDLYKKSLSDRAKSGSGLDEAEKRLDVEGLCKFVGNLSYSREIIQDSETHKSFMDKFQEYLLPVEGPPKIDKPSSRLLSSKFKRQLQWKAMQNLEKEQKLAKYKQLMDRSKITAESTQNVAVINYKNVTSYNHSSVVEILQKHPHARSKSELRLLFHNIKHLAAFQKLSAFTLEQLCGVINYSKFEADRVVFLQGDMGTSWYVTLKGSVSVKVSNTGNLKNAVVVKKIVAGEGFGDLALINDKPRAATIMTNEPCEFARIEKDDYNRILRVMHDREIKERIAFLRKMKQFESWNDDSLKTIAGLYELKTYPAGSIIIKEKDLATHFHIVQSGICHGFRSFTSDEDKQVIAHFQGNFG